MLSSDATIGDATGTETIVDDDATPTLAISGPSPQDEGNVNYTYTVAITGKSAGTVTVNYATANGTATAGPDYTAASGQLSWATGDTGNKTFVVPVKEDTLDEFDETFTSTISGASGATISTATVTSTITDDDAPVTIATVSDATVTEGNSGTVAATITVTLSAASGKPVTVPYATAPGTATEGSDYEAKSGTYSFAAGETTKAVSFNVKGDTLFEGDEKFSVVLTTPTNADAGPDMRGEITITDDESSPVPTLSAPSVLEGNPGSTVTLVFEATLPAPHTAVTYNFRTVNDSAAAPSDFVAQSGSKNFPANNTTTATKVPITINVNPDALDELDETMKLELLNNNDVVVRTATGTIRNDDNNSKLSINDATSDEPGTMTFTVTLAPASGREVKVNWATADGTATAGADYTGNSGQLTFAPGETTKAIDISVLGDSTNEENETLKVLLSNQVGIPAVNLIDGEGAGTIIDKNAPPTLSISDTLGREGQGATFTVTLAGTTLRTVTVSFNTADSTAKAGSDYAARTGTLSFAPGEKSKAITITIIDDTEAEPVEEFFVVIGDAVNATITKNRGGGSIEASDRPDTPTTPTTPTTPPTAKPTSVLVPRMILGPRTVSIGANGLARMQVTCQKISPIGCAGSVELERAAKPLLKLGKKTFTVKKGGKGYASIKLSLKSLKLLQKNGTMRVKVIVIVKTSAKSMKVSPGTITLKATRALMQAKLKAPPPTTKVVVEP